LEADIPSSLHGLITGRLDRLEKQTKRILQEASVIGRDFLYEILKKNIRSSRTHRRGTQPTGEA
jgi:predicted ATPase